MEHARLRPQTPSSPQIMVEADIYRGVDWITRTVLRTWKNAVARGAAEPTTKQALASLDARLIVGNAFTLIDHHYAFDALPLALGLAQSLPPAEGVMIP